MKIFTFCISLLIISFVNAQSKIAVVNGTTGATQMVTTMDSAVSTANNGDNIYLPGGGFTLSTALDKSVHIYGAGYDQDSSNATGITVVNPIQITSGASNGSIEGIYFTNTLSIAVSNYTFKYCYLQSGIQFGQNSDGSGSTNLVINNCYIGDYFNSIYGDFGSLSGTVGLTNSFIFNNIIVSYVKIGAQNTFANNIFFLSSSSAARSSSCTYNNNVFQFNEGGNCSNAIFNNNINAFPSISNGNTGTANASETFNNSFINSGTGPIYTYNVHNDYHLKTSSLGHNAGTDGKDVGIYGGIISWKDGSMPSNPHISSKNVSQQTDANGNLKATFVVKAQNN